MKIQRLFYCFLFLGLLLFTVPQGIAAAPYGHSYEWDVLTLVNQQRVASGLAPLAMTEKLQRAAAIRCNEIREVFSHTRPNNKTWYTVFADLNLDYNTVGENIAAGQTSPKEVVNDWLASDGHRKNILKGNFTHIGIAYRSQGSYLTDWVQTFAGTYQPSSLSMAAPAGSRVFDVGTTIEEMGETVVTYCSQYGYGYMPLITGMTSGYQPQVQGRQTITVRYGGLATSFTVIIGEDSGVTISENENRSHAGFADVPARAWFYPFITDLVAKGIIDGKTSDSFMPNDTITRAELAKILAVASNADMNSYKGYSSFSDVPDSKWYTCYINWAAAKGIVQGSGNRFYPQQNISRQEIAVMLQRYAMSCTGIRPGNAATPNFSDSDAVASWAKAAVAQMQQLGIIEGTSNGDGTYRFNPVNTAKRCEAAKIVSVFLALNGI